MEGPVTASLNLPHLIVLELSLAGVPVLGLTAESLDLVTLRHVAPGGTSPAGATLSTEDDFTLEELGNGAYALTLAEGVLSSLGQWLIRVADAAESFDAVSAVIEVAPATDTERLLWAAGVNTLGLAATYDADGRVTSWTVYGFDSADDAATYANEYANTGGLVSDATQALVRHHAQDTFGFRPDGRLKYILRQDLPEDA
jgi:hypothetical protein